MATRAKGAALSVGAMKALRSVSEDLKALDRMNLKELQTKFLLLYLPIQAARDLQVGAPLDFLGLVRLGERAPGRPEMT